MEGASACSAVTLTSSFTLSHAWLQIPKSICSLFTPSWCRVQPFIYVNILYISVSDFKS